jgi:uncharacterized protein (TIGR02145 family)
VRQSKSADCPDWQSSNEFTLTVFACSFTAGTETGATATFTDPRDGKQYKTVVMPDGRTWFAQNLNYTKDLTFNAYAREANGKMFTSVNGAQAIGSYWCPGVTGSTYSGDQNTCNIYGAMYTWQTAMMVDGKYADETKTSSAWDESWVSPYYYTEGTLGTEPNADKNNARGGTTVKGGGRGICPKGWHIPTAREWVIMLDSVEDDGKGNLFSSLSELSQEAWLYIGTDVGQKLKSVKTYAADEDDPGDGSWLYTECCAGLDSYGFEVLSAGARASAGIPQFNRGTDAYYFASSALASYRATSIGLVTYQNGVVFTNASYGGRSQALRCVMD